MKPSDRIYELAGEYDFERDGIDVVPSTKGLVWALIKYLDEQSAKKGERGCPLS